MSFLSIPNAIVLVQLKIVSCLNSYSKVLIGLPTNTLDKLSFKKYNILQTLVCLPVPLFLVVKWCSLEKVQNPKHSLKDLEGSDLEAVPVAPK